MADEPDLLASTSREALGHASLEDFTAKWYAVHTFAHHERRVNERLTAKNLNTFLPLYSLRSARKDVTAFIEKPLFPGYLFVFVPLVARLAVLKVPGVVRLVGPAGKPIPLTEQEIDCLRNARAQGVHLEPLSHLQVGQKVRIKAGPFEGFQGILIRRKGKYRVGLSLDLIACSFVLDLDIADLEVAKSRSRSGVALGPSGAQHPVDKNSIRISLRRGGAYVSPS